jgi:hypothetical protein
MEVLIIFIYFSGLLLFWLHTKPVIKKISRSIELPVSYDALNENFISISTSFYMKTDTGEVLESFNLLGDNYSIQVSME